MPSQPNLPDPNESSEAALLAHHRLQIMPHRRQISQGSTLCLLREKNWVRNCKFYYSHYWWHLCLETVRTKNCKFYFSYYWWHLFCLDLYFIRSSKFSMISYILIWISFHFRSHQHPGKTESTQVENFLECKTPKIRIKFCSEQEGYDFYNAYARAKGFSIRRSSSHNVKNTTTIKNKTFCCSRQGIKLNLSCITFFMVVDKISFWSIIYLWIGIWGPDKREEESSNCSKPKTRCMCQARMKISLRDGFYYIYEFEPIAQAKHII